MAREFRSWPIGGSSALLVPHLQSASTEYRRNLLNLPIIHQDGLKMPFIFFCIIAFIKIKTRHIKIKTQQNNRRKNKHITGKLWSEEREMCFPLPHGIVAWTLQQELTICPTVNIISTRQSA
ncbi:hypothetical protein E2C01_004427 [Portunus trituberculatus]|uniref:Uncharacterized protein n=1 Tax=Portunus trituberculatus TaxID=210409 RepID=A0A5B7CPY3_PORTR|nr:hypothetical protein [Portunus trituberculatus]